MCLVVLAVNADERFPLILAGNRDEFHSRPALDADWWVGEPEIAGGRDLLAGGTWLAIQRSGRLAVVTNLHGETTAHEPRSRGHLVADFLRGNAAALDYLQSLEYDAYNGFNLIVAADGQVGFCSNRGDAPRLLTPGIHALGNDRIDSSEQKVRTSRARLAALIDAGQVSDDALLDLLADRDGEPPTAATFVVQRDYGTRCSTAVTVSHDGVWRLVERRFDPGGIRIGEISLGFRVAEYAD